MRRINMFSYIIDPIKKALEFFNLRNPAKGIKINSEEKAAIILEYKTPDINVFVETGTEFGTMIKTVGGKFNKVYSIELDQKLYEAAVDLFKEEKHVKLFCGDSGEEIKKVLSVLHEPALFWLDAHGTGAMTVENKKHCPVLRELEEIFAHDIKGHIIIIDDARHFDLHSLSVIKKIANLNGYTYLSKDGVLRLQKR